MVGKLYLIALALAFSLASGAELGYVPVWNTPGRGGFSAPNAIKHRQSGAILGIVVCEGDVGVVCFDLTGKRLWEHPMKPPVLAAPAVGDVDGDGQEDVAAADSAGNLAVLSHDGKLKWVVSGLMGRVEADSCPAIVDLDGDGTAEILVGDMEGRLSCFRRDGTLRWQFTGDGSQMGPVLVADVYEEPGREVVVTSHDRHIYALSAEGRWLWDLYCENDLFPNSTPILADVDGDNIPELYVGGGLHHFYRIDLRAASVVHEENVHTHINGAIAATDLDGSGTDHVVFGTKAGGLWRYGAEGFRWRREFRTSTFLAAPILLDVDGDAVLEILLHSGRGDFHVLDANGADIYSYETGLGPEATPLAGDLDGDGVLEVVSTASQPGMLIYAKLGVPWREDRRNRTVFTGDRTFSGCQAAGPGFAPMKAPEHSSRTTGARLEPVDGLFLLSGLNHWRFDIENPDQDRLVLLATVSFPDGSQRHSARHANRVRERVAVSFDISERGPYTLAWRLVDAVRHAEVLAGTQSFVFEGFKSDSVYLTDVVFAATDQAARTWWQVNPKGAGHIQAALARLETRLEAVGQMSPGERLDALMPLRREAERLRDLAVACAALEPAGNLLASEACPWAYFHPYDSLPSPGRRTERLKALLVRGEYESLALNLTNVSSRTLEVRVLCVSVAPQDNPEEGLAAAKHLELRRAVLVPTIRREEVADALPRLDEGNLLTIPAFETQQLWITLHAADLAPGRYVAPITLQTVEPDPVELVVPIEFRVAALELPRPRPLRFCVWAYERGPIGTDKDEVLADLTAHGVNIFFGAPPLATCDEAGSLIGPLDFAAHDASVKRYSPHGMLLFLSPQSSLRGQPFLSIAWRKAYRTYLREWAKHMTELGMRYEDWALYPYDEPSSPFAETTLHLVEVAQLTREADPNIRIYTDPTSGATMETIDMLTGLIDIWCPSAELLERLGDEMLPVIKRVGREVWFYDAAGHSKTLSSLGIYRWRFWYAWNLGFTGAGWWTYAYGEQQWQGWNPMGDVFCTVYPGPNDVVTSKRWEAAREGVEDYELLFLLRRLVQKAETEGRSGRTLQEARRLLAELPKSVETLLRNTGRRLPLTPDSVPLYEQTTAFLENSRSELIECCLRLQRPK